MTERNVSKIGKIGIDPDQIQFPISTRPLLWGIACTLLISVALRINTILSLGNMLYNAEVESILLYSIVFAAQFTMGFVLVVLILPYLMSEPEMLHSLRSRVNPTRLLLASGIVSGGIFLLIAAGVSNVLDIFFMDWNIILAKPDVYVDPDVVGWYYFIFALIPAIFEEIVFRGIILFQLRSKYSDRMAILLSSVLFSLYHFSVILSRPIDAVIGGVIMSFFYGLAWGSLVLQTNSILPSMIAHYIIDTFGFLFLNVEDVDPVVLTQFMLIITILYPVIHWLVFRFIRGDTSPNNVNVG